MIHIYVYFYYMCLYEYIYIYMYICHVYEARSVPFFEKKYICIYVLQLSLIGKDMNFVPIFPLPSFLSGIAHLIFHPQC